MNREDIIIISKIECICPMIDFCNIQSFLGDFHHLNIFPRKWKKIANQGRKHALENLNNAIAVDSLADLMESLI